MVIRDILLCEAEERFYEFEDFCSNIEENSGFNSDTIKVLKSDAYYLIDEIGIKIHEAVCCKYNEDTSEYNPEFYLFIFYDLHNSNIVYEEGDTTLVLALSNFINTLDTKYTLDNLRCDLISE